MRPSMQRMAIQLGAYGFVRIPSASKPELTDRRNPMLDRYVGEVLAASGRAYARRSENGDRVQLVALNPSEHSYWGKQTPGGVRVSFYDLYPTSQTGSIRLARLDKDRKPQHNNERILLEDVFNFL